MDNKHYIDIDCNLGCRVLVVDTSEHLWLKVLRDNDIPYKIVMEGTKLSCDYKILILRISKKYRNVLDVVAKKVEDTFMLMGYKDYPEFRDNLFNKLNSNIA